MSTTIDQKVVEMRFDNKHFEQNVSKTMSTLDKLKQKLRLDGATRGLEDVNSASKKINMAGLGSAVESVGVKFSALQVMGVTALTNITNSAINAGKRIVESLTIAPIKDGFDEYEMTLNAVQTTMAATGKTAKEVETELKKLDEYADKTVYGTADMLSNLPKFTNAGVDLEKATTAMIGIANATALAGGDAGKASIAFYNLGQAIGTGYLTRMDYNSINNAGIATMEWKNQMVEAAIAQGTLTKVGEDAYQAGNKTLTLQQLFIDGLQEQWATTEVMMKVFGDYGDETTDIGKKAYSAAQDIKTFTQMMESLKATAGTGWKDTWQIIFGDLDQAKELWTGLTNFVSNLISKTTEFRNSILAGALESPFADIARKIKSVTGVTEDMVEVMQDYTDVVNRVIRGDFGNGQARWDKLTDSGYNWATIQNMVNEQLGVTVRHTERLADAQKDVNKSRSVTIEQLAEMSEEQLKTLDFTDRQIEAFAKLREQSELTGISLEKLLENPDQLSGRDLLINSFKNVGSGFIGFFTAMKNAWDFIFPSTAEERANELYKFIASMHKLSTGLRLTDIETGALTETAEKLQRVFQGLFAAIDIVTTITGGGLKLAFEVVVEILKHFDLNILDAAAAIGDVIVKVRDLVDSIIDIPGLVKLIIPWVQRAIELAKEWITSLKESETLQNFLDYLIRVRDGIRDVFSGISSSDEFSKLVKVLNSAATSIREWFESLKVSKDIPGDIISGLANGIRNGIPIIFRAILELGKSIILGICDVLGIHSPSTVMIAIGGFLISGLLVGITSAFPDLLNGVGGLFKSFTGLFDKLNLGVVLTWLSTLITFIPKIPIAGLVRKTSAINNLVKTTGNSMKTTLENTGEKIQDGGSAIFDGIKRVFTSIVDWVKNLDFGVVISVALVGGLLMAVFQLAKVAYKLIDVVGMFAAPFDGLGKLFKNAAGVVEIFGEGLKKNLRAKNFKTTAEGILSIAIAVGILAAAAVVLSKVPVLDLLKAGGAIVVLGAIVIAMGMVASKMTSVGVGFAKLALAMIGISAAMLIIAVVMKKITEIDPTRIPIASAVLSGIMLLLSGFVAVCGTFAKGSNAQYVNRVGTMLVKMTVALLLMTFVIKLLAGMSEETIETGFGRLAAISALFSTFVLVSKASGQYANKAGNMLLKMSVAMLLMIGVVKLASMLTQHEVEKGIATISGIGLIFTAMIAVSKLAGQNAGKAGTMLIGIAVAMLAVIVAIERIAKYDSETLKKGLAVVAVLEALFAGLIAVSYFAGSNAIKAGAMLVLVSIALLVTTGVMYLLGRFDTDSLKRALGIVTVLEILFGGLIAVSHLASNCTGTIITLTVAVAVLTAAIVSLTFVDPQKLSYATAAIAMVISAFALLAFATSKIGSTKGMVGTLITLGVIVALLTVLAIGMTHIDGEASLKNATTISILLLSMSAAMAILSKAGKVPIGAIGALALMVLVVGELAVVLGLMEHFNVESSMANVAALSILLTVMSGVLVVLGLIGAKSASAFAGIGALAVLGLVVAELAAILGLMEHFDINPSMETVEALSLLLIAMSGALVVLGVVGLLGPAAFIGIGALAVLIAGIGGLIVGIGALVDKFPALEEFLNKGMPILEKIGFAIGSFFGNIVGGFMSGVTDGLPEIGTTLSDFMTNVTPFIDGLKNVDDGAIDGAKALVATVRAFSAADLLSSVRSFISEGSALPQLGTDLTAFMTNASGFIDGVSKLDPSLMNGAKSLSEAILALTGANILNSLTSWFTGGVSLADFGTELAEFGPHMAAYASAVAGIDTEAVRVSAEAAKALGEMAEGLPNSGGWLGAIVGENDMSSFGSQLSGFGDALVAYSKSVTGLNVDSITNSIPAAQSIVDVANAIPNSGGWLGEIVGENDLNMFGTQMALFGRAMLLYSSYVKQVDSAAITDSVPAAKGIVDVANAIPNSGGVAGFFAGNNDINDFGNKLVSFGSSLASYSEVVKTVDKSAIDNSVTSARKIIRLIEDMVDIDDSGIGKFSNALESMASISIDNLVNAFNGNSSRLTSVGQSIVDPIISGIKSKRTYFVTAGNSLITELESGFKTRSDSVKNVATGVVRTLVDAIVDSRNLIKATAVGLMSGFILGLETKKNDVTSAIKVTLDNAISSIKGYYSSFYASGAYLVYGFTDGISANIASAASAAASMASSAAAAARTHLRINSPSKVFYEIGDYSGQGFVNALYDYADTSYEAGSEMADSARLGLRNAIGRIVDIINSDMDTQPTIRPVLDLSDVEAGVSSIGGMFGMRPSVGVLGNVGAISATMSGFGQNGDNHEVVSAINKLNKSLGKVGNTTYNINGITYDDGSNITEAVKTLVRATRIERRT